MFLPYYIWPFLFTVTNTPPHVIPARPVMYDMRGDEDILLLAWYYMETYGTQIGTY